MLVHIWELLLIKSIYNQIYSFIYLLIEQIY